MQENLVIVESPAKAKTIEKFLGKDYKVIAGEKTIRNFINSKLIERQLDDNSTGIFFVGEYKYAPEFWRVESGSQIKKIINYIVFKNMSL